ncbi:hybrid sensor histidine kinase/response regulator transcription factor [Parabacteroides goldsteinii]|uniref:hybrid sensor histidine kinase/response regulator transcription factor n=4 Tax=Parabacteroides goldsteinii TaxID=328812 RepID=UPI002575AB59|nr:hybrid sensor histidine kinase/response regulator transcription factor [Parabacteroides goldsteinii]
MGVIYRLMLTLILSLHLITIYAENENPFFFSHLDVEDGLSQVSILSIFQDSEGYIWFGTRNGANRYDGYEFKVYQNEVNNPASISDNYIRKISEDKDKNIWIGTSNGVNCIDYRTQQISRFYPQAINPQITTNAVNNFLRHADGELYAFTTRSILKCNSDKTVEEMPYLTEMKSPIHSVAQDSDGDIFIGTEDKGLYIFTSGWKLKKHYLPDSSNNQQTLPISTISALLPGPGNTVFIGTNENGLCLYNKKEQTFTRLNTDNSGLNNNSVRHLTVLSKDSVLIGTFRGLNILNTQNMIITPINMDMKAKGALSHYSIHSMLIDRDQTLWVGTYSAGVNYHSPFYRPASFITTNSFAGIIGQGREDSNGNMWFTTEGAGLLYYNPRTEEQKLYPIKPLQAGNYEINILKSILIQGDSILCSTHFGSVYLFSIRNKQYKKIHDYKYNDINTLYIDNKQRLWIPTNTPDQTVMADKEKTTSYFNVNGHKKQFRGICLIKELEPDVFLFGAISDSVFVYDMNKETATDLTSLLQNGDKRKRLGSISGALKDDNQFIWIATTKGGLFRLDSNLNLIQNYQKENGLSESYINSLSIDKNGDIWVVTGKELYKLNRPENKFELVKPVDSPTQEYSLYANNCVSNDGTLYFPGNQGILAINPQKVITNPNRPPVYVTSLLINSQEDPEGLPTYQELLPLQYNNNITLKASQGNITIRYSALNFIHSEDNSYAYMMEGADHNWHNIGNRREAYYSNLSPGKYTFRVKAANNDGVWNPEEAVLHITVNPPFYKTWWAYSLYLCILSLIITLIIRWQHRKHEREREEKYRQLEQERMNELHEERMRMFTNFSHELRTPLTLIINPLNDLLQRVTFSPEVKDALQLIKKNTGRMLLLVNNLMDIQKYEAGKTILQKTRFNFSTFMNEMYRSFESVATNREITFRLENKLPESFFTCYDEAEIEKVFFNLLSNAFKFTPSGGQITITIRQIAQNDCEGLPVFPEDEASILIENSYLFIEITDTGKGFNQKDAEKIFEPFYRAKGDIHKQVSGTGIGLSLTRSIVQQHQGCIWAESIEGEGTHFMILLPDTEKQKVQTDEVPASRPSEISKKVALLVEETETRNKQIILLVDDNQEVLEYLEQQLQHDYIVMKAINGKDALEQIDKTYPHIVISDVMMPEMNGLELCRRIKEDQNFCHIPVILLTAKSMVSQIEEGLEAGADDYIVKPFHVSLLKARIKNILSLREKMKNLYGESLTLKQLGVEKPEEDNDFLNRYIEIVKANISNQELDVSVIYQALGMSRANFYRKVKAVTGLSPIELIKNIRLEAGAKLLKESNMNVSEVAQHIGFSSRSSPGASKRYTECRLPNTRKVNKTA